MIRYLYINREKPRVASLRWLVVWGKRFMHSYSLLIICLRYSILKLRGVALGEVVYVDRIKIKGKAGRLSVERFSTIGQNVTVALHDKVTIGCCVVISDGVSLLTGSHDINKPDWPLVRKPIRICDYVWISAHAVILPGVTVGEGAVVGAGAVVCKDVAPYTVVGGNPAKGLGGRKRGLFYEPVKMCAPVEAWVGK